MNHPDYRYLLLEQASELHPDGVEQLLADESVPAAPVERDYDGLLAGYCELVLDWGAEIRARRAVEEERDMLLAYIRGMRGVEDAPMREAAHPPGWITPGMQALAGAGA